MQHAQNVLVVTLFVLLGVCTLLVNIKNPRVGLRAWYLGEGREFKKAKLPQYISVLLLTGALGLVYAYAISRNFGLTLQFTFGCIAIVAIAGISLILYGAIPGEDKHK